MIPVSEDQPAAPAATRAAIVAVSMGYGHLRAAGALADAAGTEVLRADAPPLASPDEVRRWDRLRSGYESLSRAGEWPLVGPAAGWLLNELTRIQGLHTEKDLTPPDRGARTLQRYAREGLGAELVGYLRERDQALLTTFYSTAIVAAEAGLEDVTCVVTDADVHRIWVPVDPVKAPITYCAPAKRTALRLRAYGVPEERIRITGFPLPPGLLGGDDLTALRENLAWRIRRLDRKGRFVREQRTEIEERLELPEVHGPRAPTLVFAVGGAGAQTRLACTAIEDLAPLVRSGTIRLALVAGTRRRVAERLHGELERERLVDHSGVELLVADDFETYRRRFEELLARSDILWTKPSEMTFYGALGLPLVLSTPVGDHERFNRRWARRRGVALHGVHPHYVFKRMKDWLESGELARAAWCGYRHMPKRGTYRILEPF